MTMQDEIIKRTTAALLSANHSELAHKINSINKSQIHVAVMVEPYLSLILEGIKTIESRFSKKRISPYAHVRSGDVVVLKKSGGGYTAVFEVGEVLFFEPQTESDILHIKEVYNDKLCIADSFWNEKKDAHYVTLIKITNLCVFKEFQIKIPNRQSWIDFEDTVWIQESMFKQPAVICIAGKAGSGKTTVAKYLSTQLNCRYVTVSDYLKSLCDGEELSRDILQAKGDECIQHGWAHFVQSFLRFVNWDGQNALIIDGVRHVSFMDMLKVYLYPNRPICVYLDADEDTIQKHIAFRGSETINRMPLSEGYEEKLHQCADVIIPGNTSVSESIDIIQVYLSLHSEMTSDENTKLSVIRQYIDNFNSMRGWKRYHNYRDLAISISIEAAELLEIFQWGGGNGSTEHIQDELADVLIYCINLANSMGVDLTKIILDKLQKNAIKYPVKETNTNKV